MTDDTVTIRAASYESLALAVPVPYVLPLAQLAPNAQSFDFWWRLLNYALRLPSPHGFLFVPELAGNDVLSRFCDAAKDLAGSECLSQGGGVTINVTRADDGSQQESITARFPDKELIRGFLALFRQFYSTDEVASFVKAKSLLMKTLRAESRQETDTSLSILKAWGKAQGLLRAHTVKNLVGMRLVQEGRLSDFPDDGSPEELISAFAYGEHLHWGDKRDQVARWRADTFLGPWNEMSFFEAVSGLAHFYMGYAVIIAGALGRTDLSE